MEKNNKEINKKATNSLANGRKIAGANYTVLMIAVALVIVVVINILISSLSPDIREFDLSKESIFTLTDETKEYLETVDKDVTVYIVARPGNTNNDLVRLLELYEDECSHINVKMMDHTTNPDFLNTRGISISEGSIVVEYGDKCKAVELTEMIITSKDSSTGSTYQIYDMEGQITSAINYVLADNVPKAYMISGTGRAALDDKYITEIKKQNIDVTKLSISETSKIPEDAAILILNQPAKDLTEVEYNEIYDFMEKGGSLLVYQYQATKGDFYMPYLQELFSHYGIEMTDGLVVEKNSNYIYDIKKLNFRPIMVEHEITKSLMEDEIKLAAAWPYSIQINDVPKSVTVSPLLTSTSSAYYKSRQDTTLEQLATDDVGTFNYAVAVTDDISDLVQSRMVFISAYSFADTTVIDSSETMVKNDEAFVISSMKWLANQDLTISVPMKTKSFANIIYTEQARNRILYTIVLAIPVVVLGYGSFVWYKRRKR